MKISTKMINGIQKKVPLQLFYWVLNVSPQPLGYLHQVPVLNSVTSSFYLSAGIFCKWRQFFIPNVPYSNSIGALFFPNVEIYKVNFLPPVLEVIRNKQISSHVALELKSRTNTPLPQQFFTNTVTEQQIKVLSGFPSKKLKPDLCSIKSLVQCSIDAPLCSCVRHTSVSAI